MGDTPLVMNQTRGALWGGKWGDRGRGGLDDDGALLVMLQYSKYESTLRDSSNATYKEPSDHQRRIDARSQAGASQYQI